MDRRRGRRGRWRCGSRSSVAGCGLVSHGESRRLLQEHLGADFACTIVDSTAEVGSGAQPTLPITSRALTVVHRSWSAETTAAFFRSAEPPILGRIRQEEFRLELHAVEMPEDLLPMHAEPSQ